MSFFILCGRNKKRDREERSIAVGVGACVCANRDLPCISSMYAKYDII